MTFIGVAEALGFGAAVAALGMLIVGKRRGLQRDVALLFGVLILLTALINLSNVLELNGIVASLDPSEDHMETLQPVLWGFVLYSVIQAAAQSKLQESERKNRLLLANLPQRIYFKDHDLNYVSVNATFAENLGKQRDEIVGKTDLDIFPPGVARRYRAADLHVMESREPHTEVEEKGNGDATRVVEVSRIPVLDDDGKLTGLLGIVTDITERTETRRALAKAEREKAAILHSMSELVVYQDAEMNILWSNNAAARSFDLRPEEMAGSKCYRLWQDREEHCEGCPVVEARRTGSPAEGEVRTPDDRIWSVRAYPVHSPEQELLGVVEVAEDVTEEKHAEDAYAQLAAVVEASDEDIIGLAPDGTVTSWNPGAERIYGYSADEFIGRSLDELMSTQLGDDLNSVFERVVKGESRQQYETMTVTRDGRLIHVSLTLSPIYGSSGRVAGVSVIARDITEQVRLREELRMLSLIDTLTELHNRRGFLHLATQELKVAARIGESALLIFADVDNMKHINDAHGHQQGDDALVAAADVLRETFRQSDIIGRVGGDEFAVLALDAQATSRSEIISRMESAVAAKNRQLDRPWELSLSVGVAFYNPQLPSSLDELLAEADALMYEHKRSKFGSRYGASTN
jgi:diguanylate cyclase (GGDEF)-like protein/PAS domain S-box-containing protein